MHIYKTKIPQVNTAPTNYERCFICNKQCDSFVSVRRYKGSAKEYKEIRPAPKKKTMLYKRTNCNSKMKTIKYKTHLYERYGVKINYCNNSECINFGKMFETKI